jgi:hypothetical protein
MHALSLHLSSFFLMPQFLLLLIRSSRGILASQSTITTPFAFSSSYIRSVNGKDEDHEDA